MSAWSLGIALAVLVVVVGLPYIWFVRRGDHGTEAGLRALAGLRWREFSTLVGQALQQRGLRDAGRAEERAGDGGSRLLMTDGTHRWLLACKHGRAYRLGRAHVEELAGEMDLAGARYGILLTEGRAMRESLSAAAGHGIEIIDGRRLWPLLRPYVPVETRVEVNAASDTRARTEAWLLVLAALVLGVSAAVWGPQLRQKLAAPATTPQAAAPAQSTVPASLLPAEPEPLPEDADIVAYPDEPTLLRYQGEVARAISVLPGVHRAHWLTQATLVVDRSGSIDAIWPLVCAEIERYPALRTIRVQLNPRPGRDEPVRWRQCRTQ